MSHKPPTEPQPQPQSATATSRSLLVRAQGHDPAAWDRLVSLYAPLVHHWCRKMQLDEQEIPDVVQEIFASVTTNIDRFRHDRPGDTFRGWLRTVTRSKVLDYYRRDDRQDHGAGGTDAQHRMLQIAAGEKQGPSDHGRDDEGDNLDKDGDVLDDDEQARSLRRQQFQQALEFIRTDFRPLTWQAFWRVAVDGLTPQEAAEELSMTSGAVRVAKCRVLQRLRQELGELLE
jgi:RNA polymerase sigma-70 factor (ECF subfamily)